MQYTTNLELKKPSTNDEASIGDINDNMDILDSYFGDLSALLDSINGEVI